MADKITWADKESLVTDPTIAEINKVTDDNMNEIKSVTNTNADQLDETIVYDENNITTNTKALIKQGNYRYINSEIDNQYGTATNRGYSQEFLNGYELYKNITSSNIGGGDTPITLSDSITNYRKIKIYFDRYGIQKSVEIYTDILPVTNTIGVVLDIQLFLNGIYRLYTSYYTLSGTTMTLSSRAFWNSDGQPPTTQADNQIRISRIIGYK